MSCRDVRATFLENNYSDAFGTTRAEQAVGWGASAVLTFGL